METNQFEALKTSIERLTSQVEDLQSFIEKANTQLLTLEEACKLLNLTRATVYQKVSKKEIPFSKYANRLYFEKSSLIRWIMNQQEQPKP